ncbi:MAG: hypothetical protein CME98_17265 [Hyphomonas sp.]|nr:hypothetical protein [Hyphomonas sp.]
MCHDSLEWHMRTNLVLTRHCNMSIDALNDMMPWERTTYFNMYLEEMKKEQEESMKSNHA